MSDETVVTATLPLPDDFQSLGFKAVAVEVLQAALARGKLSVFEIAALLPKGVRRDRERFSEIITWLTRFMTSRGLKLVTDREEPKHREQYPIRKPVKQLHFRIPKAAEDNETSEPKIQEGLLAPIPNKWVCKGKSKKNKNYDPLIEIYKKEMARYALLTTPQEQELGRRIQGGQDGEARNELVVHNLRLVFSIAIRYQKVMDLYDCIQAGNIGLMTAAGKFNPTLGFKFSTYATWWIRQGITREIANAANLIRTPVHMREIYWDITKAIRALESKLDREPTEKELAAETGIAEHRLSLILFRMKAQLVKSLDDDMGGYSGGSLGEESGMTLGDEVAEQRSLSPELILEAKEELQAAQDRVKHILQEIATSLDVSGRNAEVFKTFYGFDGLGKRRTLEATAQLFPNETGEPLTRERIRQIIATIWSKVDERDGDMDHDKLLEELNRIELLSRLVTTDTESDKD